MSEYVPTEEVKAEMRHTLMLLQAFPRGESTSFAYFATSQEVADWTEARLAEAGEGGRVQYVVVAG